MTREQYYIRVRGQKEGPFSRDELELRARAGVLTPVHGISTDGKSWQLARDLPGLFAPNLAIGQPPVVSVPDLPQSPEIAGNSGPAMSEAEVSTEVTAPHKVRLLPIVAASLALLTLVAAAGVGTYLAMARYTPARPVASSRVGDRPVARANVPTSPVRVPAAATMPRSSGNSAPSAPSIFSTTEPATVTASTGPASTTAATVDSYSNEADLHATVGLVVAGGEAVLADGRLDQAPLSTGTAFVVAANGFMLTNRHVVQQHLELSRAQAYKQKLLQTFGVRLQERLWVFVHGRKFEARVHYTSPTYDLAILKIDARCPKVFTLMDERRATLDQDVRAVGFPLTGQKCLSREEAFQRQLKDTTLHEDVQACFQPRDFELLLTAGRVGRSLRDEAGKCDFLQHSAPINPGNSGGPLLANDGVVLGINTIGDQNAAGFYFAVSMGQLREELDAKVPGLIWVKKSP